jgi:hypothetical protein
MIVFFLTHAGGVGVIMSAEMQRYVAMFDSDLGEPTTLLMQSFKPSGSAVYDPRNFISFFLMNSLSLVPSDIGRIYCSLQNNPSISAPLTFGAQNRDSQDLAFRLLARDTNYLTQPFEMGPDTTSKYTKRFLSGASIEALLIPRYRPALLQGNLYTAQMRTMLAMLLSRFLPEYKDEASMRKLAHQFDWADSIPCRAEPNGAAWLSPVPDVTSFIRRREMVADVRKGFLSTVRAVEASPAAKAGEDWHWVDAVTHDALSQLEAALLSNIKRMIEAFDKEHGLSDLQLGIPDMHAEWHRRPSSATALTAQVPCEVPNAPDGYQDDAASEVDSEDSALEDGNAGVCFPVALLTELTNDIADGLTWPPSPVTHSTSNDAKYACVGNLESIASASRQRLASEQEEGQPDRKRRRRQEPDHDVKVKIEE